MRASFHTKEVYKEIECKIKAIDDALDQHDDIFKRYLDLPFCRRELLNRSPYNNSFAFSTAEEYRKAHMKLMLMKNLLHGLQKASYELTSLSENEYDRIYTQSYPWLHSPEYVAALKREEKLLRRRERRREKISTQV